MKTPQELVDIANGEDNKEYVNIARTALFDSTNSMGMLKNFKNLEVSFSVIQAGGLFLTVSYTANDVDHFWDWKCTDWAMFDFESKLPFAYVVSKVKYGLKTNTNPPEDGMYTPWKNTTNKLQAYFFLCQDAIEQRDTRENLWREFERVQAL